MREKRLSILLVFLLYYFFVYLFYLFCNSNKLLSLYLCCCHCPVFRTFRICAKWSAAQHRPAAVWQHCRCCCRCRYRSRCRRRRRSRCRCCVCNPVCAVPHTNVSVKACGRKLRTATKKIRLKNGSLCMGRVGSAQQRRERQQQR